MLLFVIPYIYIFPCFNPILSDLFGFSLLLLGTTKRVINVKASEKIV